VLEVTFLSCLVASPSRRGADTGCRGEVRIATVWATEVSLTAPLRRDDHEVTADDRRPLNVRTYGTY